MHSFCGFTTKWLLRGDLRGNLRGDLRGDLRVTLSEAALEENVLQIDRSDLGFWSLRQRLHQSGLIVRTHRLSMDKWVWPPERESHMLFDCCWYGKGCDRHIYWHNDP